jgi:putative hydrolase of the HAD superfamily
LTVQAVLFDVDFTLCRPGPELGPEGYEILAAAHGIELDTSRFEEARLAAIDDLRRHPELDHDEEIWLRFTEDIVRGMGGEDGDAIRAIAEEILERWRHAAHFELYDDAVPTLRDLRCRGLKLGLVSNTSRDLAAFVSHFELDVDAWITSGTHGKVKPSPLIFQAALDLVGAVPAEAVMVGDSVEDDVGGARAVGMGAVLIDRIGRYPEAPDRIETLAQLPAALGLVPGR